MNLPVLKPCPFCGSDNIYIHEVKKLPTLNAYYSGESTEFKNPFFACCTHCQVHTTSHPSIREAAIVWNTRADHPNTYNEILIDAFNTNDEQ